MGAPGSDATPNPTWVTVPIPEDLLDQVQVFVLHLGLRGTPHAWDADAMREHLARLDERSRHVVGAIAESALLGSPLAAPALAERLGLHVREVFGIMHLANDVVGVPRPDLLWTAPPEEGASVVDRVLMMSEPVAELVVAVQRDEGA